MKKLLCAAGLMALSACVTPTPPSGAVPFSQVLAENAVRPFECTNYDAATDSCEGVARYQDLGNGRFAFTGDFVLDPTMPIARMTGVAMARGDLVCVDFGSVSISAAGTSDLASELMFAEFENFFATVGESCAAYIRMGDGYGVRTVTGPAFMRAQPDQRAQFFAGSKPLRAPAF